MKKKTIWSLILNSLIVISSGYGVYLSLFAHGFMSKGTILYYTIQSNLFVLLISIIFIIVDIKKLKGEKSNQQVFYLLKYISTVAITITFLVFSLLLTPQMILNNTGNYLLSLGNLTVHFISPILAIVSFLCFDNSLKIKRRTYLYGLIGPLYYLFLALILSLISEKGLFMGIDGLPSKAPYFFLDYTSNGWFTLSNNIFKIGSFYWIVFCVFLTILIARLYLRVIPKKNN